MSVAGEDCGGVAQAPLGQQVAGPVLAQPNRAVALSGLLPDEPYTLTVLGRDGMYRAPGTFTVPQGMLLRLYLDLPPGAWSAGQPRARAGPGPERGAPNSFLVRQEFSAPEGPARAPGFYWGK